MNPVERLVALEEIRALPFRYASAIERRDLDAMAELFSPDARFGEWGTGEAGLRALMSASMSTCVLALILVANHLVEFDDDDHAHGHVWARCYAQNEPGGFVEQVIKYEDAYKQADGRWQFLRRRHRLWFGVEVTPSPLRQQVANWPAAQVGVGDGPLDDPAFAAWREREGL